MIALDLTSECDPALLAKCAAFFIENGQFDKAVDMFAISKKVSWWVAAVSQDRQIWVGNNT